MVKDRFNLLIACITVATLAFLLSVDLASSKTAITREQVLADAKTTEDLLKKYHPNLYAHRTPKQIKSIWDNAKSQLPDNPDFLDAATLIQQMLAAVCDEHTLVRPKDSWIFKEGWVPGFFPAGLVVVKDKLYLDDLLFSQKTQEVFSINKRNSDEIIKFLKSIVSVDGCQNSEVLFSHHVGSQLIVSFLLTNFLEAGPSFHVKYKDGETGAIVDSSVPSASLSKLRQRSRYRSIQGRSMPLKSIGIESSERDWEFAVDIARQILVRSDATKSTIYVYIPSFDGGKAQASAIDKEMRDLVKANPDYVIVDLTDNPGGSYGNTQGFMSYFLRTSSRMSVAMRSRITRAISDSNYTWGSTKRRESYSAYIGQFKNVRKRGGQYRLTERPRSFGNKSYRGSLTVLVSPKTGSAAITMATILKRKAGATIVGDIGDASMVTSCSGAPGVHLLKTSRTAILVPLDCGDRHPDAKRKGNLLQPDVPVDIAAQDSSKTNVAILSAAIEALKLKEAVSSNSVGKSGENPTKPSLEQVLEREAAEKEISVTLLERPGMRGSGWVGVGLVKLDTGVPELGNEPALLVNKVFPGSPAFRSGLQAGDIILSVHGPEIRDPKKFIESVFRSRPGDQVLIKVLRLANTTEELVSILSDHLVSPEDRKVAAFILGSLYLSGGFGHLKRNDSIRLLDLAADSGSANASAVLGDIYSGSERNSVYTRGAIAVKEFDLAVKYYTKAAALEMRKSCLNLRKYMMTASRAFVSSGASNEVTPALIWRQSTCCIPTRGATKKRGMLCSKPHTSGRNVLVSS